MCEANYYAIIPANVRYAKDLSFLEKFLFAEMTALSNMSGYCSASNKYFAQLYDKTEETISRAISKLQKLSFINIEYEKEGSVVIKRKIYPLTRRTNEYIANSTETAVDKNINREQHKFLLAVDKNIKENNSLSYKSILDLIEKEKYKKEKDFSQDVQSIFDHWNSKSIIVHQTLSDALGKVIKNSLSSFGSGLIIMAIDRYKQILEDKAYFFKYKWSLKDFLSRKEGISSFLDDGSKWLSYKNFLEQNVLKETNKYIVKPQRKDTSKVDSYGVISL